MSWVFKNRGQITPWLYAKVLETTKMWDWMTQTDTGSLFLQKRFWYYCLARCHWKRDEKWVNSIWHLGKSATLLFDHHYIDCHMILDVMMDNFCHKTQLAAGVHIIMKATSSLSYAISIPQETVHVALLIAWPANVLTDYITIPC